MPFGGTTSAQDTKIDSCISKVSGTNPRTKKPFTKSEKVAICKSQVMRTKGEKKFCFESNVELKAIGTGKDLEYHITGFVSAPYVDSEDDFIPESLQSKIVDRINSGFANRGSWNHDFVIEGNLLPVASAKSELKLHPKLDLQSAWVDVTLDQDSSKFDEIKEHFDNKTIKGFSIEYTENPPSHHEIMNGKSVRVFDDVPMFGFGIIGGDYTPINSMAFADGLEYKAYFEMKADHGKEEENPDKKKKKSKKNPEVEKMSEEKKDDVEKKAEEKEKKPEDTEEKKEETKETPEVEKKAVDFEKLGKQVHAEKVAAKKLVELKAVAKTAIEAEMKAVQEKQPYLNPAPKFDEVTEFDAEIKSFNELLKDNTADVELKYQAAARMHDKLHPYGISQRGTNNFQVKKYGKSFRIGGKAMQDIEMKAFEYKAQLEHDTNKTLDTDYYQNAAELNDIYDPVIASHLNDKTTLWGLMRKKNVSNIGSDRYGFRFWRTRVEGVGGNSSTYNYDEGDTLTGYHAKMLKAQIPFMQYGVTIQVSGLTIAEARGSVGDIVSLQIQRGTADLLRGINADLYGTATGFTDGGKILGLEVLGDDGGAYSDLYGHDRSTFTTLQGTDEAVSNTPNIDKTLLRKMMRTAEKNGANMGSMIYVTDPIQRDKILGLLDPAQRFNNTSARAGFEGMPMFNGYPIHSDDQCNDGYIYALPMDKYYAAVLLSPTVEELAKTDDSRKMFVKTYFAVVCENPNFVYKVTGLNTS